MTLSRFSLLRRSISRRGYATLSPKYKTSITLDGMEQHYVESTIIIPEAFDYLNTVNIAVLGYGSQGRAQALNMHDDGMDVTVGVRKGASWDRAVEDGWISGHNLFEIDEAAHRSGRIHYLLHDLEQKNCWEQVRSNLHPDDQLCFSHGFGVKYLGLDNVGREEGVDVFMVAPKCSGNMLRENYMNGVPTNASYAIFYDWSGLARDRCVAAGLSMGCSNLFPTTFTEEVLSDLTGERLVLMGTIRAAMEAQYEVLIENGHSPLEAWNETVVEAEHLYKMMWDKGMDWLYHNCSTTAQTGALEWSENLKPSLKKKFVECYDSVASGKEAEKAIKVGEDPEYRKKLDDQLKEMAQHPLWTTHRKMTQMK